MSQLFTSSGQSIGVSASISVLPMNTQDFSHLGWTGWISLQSKVIPIHPETAPLQGLFPSSAQERKPPIPTFLPQPGTPLTPHLLLTTLSPICSSIQLGTPSGATLWLWCMALSSWQLLLLWSKGSRSPRLQSLQLSGSKAQAQELWPPLPRSRRVPSRSGDPREHNWDRPPRTPGPKTPAGSLPEPFEPLLH